MSFRLNFAVATFDVVTAAVMPRFNEDSLAVTVATTDATVDALVNEGPAIDVVTRHEEEDVKLGALFNLPFSKFLRFVPAELWPLELEVEDAIKTSWRHRSHNQLSNEFTLRCFHLLVEEVKKLIEYAKAYFYTNTNTINTETLYGEK
uniref:Uncharacterized protein n=1 Tax=Glossina austeni TaxID=7395 RepID=A0A1A9UT92_GLOAU